MTAQRAGLIVAVSVVLGCARGAPDSTEAPGSAEAPDGAEAPGSAEAPYCTEHTPNVATVEALMAGFNDHDTGAIAELVHAQVEWLSVLGQQVAFEANGVDELVGGLGDYFAACPTCRSALVSVCAMGSRVVTYEAASWEHEGETRTQGSVAVYEFEDGAVRRVYYFPADR